MLTLYTIHLLYMCSTFYCAGGADGTVLQWDVSDGNLQDSRFAAPSAITLCINQCSTVYCAGGADGTVLQWDVSDGNLQDSRFAAPSVTIPSPFGPTDKHAPSIRCVWQWCECA